MLFFPGQSERNSDAFIQNSFGFNKHYALNTRATILTKIKKKNKKLFTE